MLQIGKTSVYFSGDSIRCESYTGDIFSSKVVKHRILNVDKVCDNRFKIQTNKGAGSIQFNESRTGNYVVELVLPKLFGQHRFYGTATTTNVESTLRKLNEL